MTYDPPDYDPGSPVPPALADALSAAQDALYQWQQTHAELARLNQPNQVAVAQVNSEIIVAQADVDAARQAIIDAG